ncbi:MAG: transcription antitermination factor NusB, partial [Patescibacteria group bacterium]|nr:transcription antitermination factor NusB [Patescibacteria group bacterium]
MSNRHLARTIAMQTLFAWDFNGKKEKNLDSLVRQNFRQFAPKFDDHGFVMSIVKGVIDNEAEIDRYIIKYATEWPLNQITIVDR